MRGIIKDMQYPKVSLIIPAFNEEKYIRDCLTCATKNGKGLFEIIVVDNGSTDQTVAIIKDFPTVKLLHENRKGPTFARQRGFKEATGDVLAFIDADTQMPEDWHETLTTEFKHNRELVCLSGPYSFYDFPKWQQFLVHGIFWDFGVRISTNLFGNVVVGGNFAIKKETLEQMSGFDENIIFYGDDTNIGRRAKEFGQVKFNHELVMPTSGRRFNHQGFFKVLGLYLVNYFSELFAHRPATEDYVDFR